MKTITNWDSLVEDLGPKLYRYFAARFDEMVADDLTQETLIRLVKKHDSGDFDEKKGSVSMYAFGIARFVRLESLKKGAQQSQTFEGEVDQVADNTDLQGDFELQDDITQLRQGISSLPEPQQEIILLMIDKELSMGQISQLLDMPSGTVKSHVHRAKKTLLSKLSNTLGGPYGQQI